MITVWFIDITMLLVSGTLVTVGLRGLVTKKPLLFSARWHYGFPLLAFLPTVILPLERLPTGQHGPMGPFDILLPLIYVVFLVGFWVQGRGYIAYGVTEDSFRNALNNALDTLHLPHEETRSRVRLTSLGADLQLSLHGWGMGELQIKPARFGLTLDRIAAGMKANLETSSAQTNITWFIFLLVAGVVITGLTLALIAA